MLKLRKIAITGGIASGKSSVCRVFQELGAFVVNADAIVHELLSSHTNLRQQVIRLLGPDILVNGEISRRVIADKVFKNLDVLHALENILHPAVLQKIEELYKDACQSGNYSAFVVEFPLLFETGQESFYDLVIAVTSDASISQKRFQKSGLSLEEYNLRMKRQIPPEEKAHRASFVIINNGSLEDLRKQIIALNNQQKIVRGHLP